MRAIAATFVAVALWLAGIAQAGEPAAAVALRLRDATRDGSREAWVENRLAGPVEVTLRDARGATPTLPARAVLQAYERRAIATLASPDARDLQLDSVPGAPDARPQDVEYGYPLQTSELRIEQGWGGRFSHADAANRHAIDFGADIGTPVVAARAGTVMEIENGFARNGHDARQDGERANYVRVLHDDGTMALYAHLDRDGVVARVGQRVRRGDALGLSGNTGYSNGPHLHFVVQINRGMRLESVPFKMFGPQGILRFREPASTAGDDQ